MKTLRAAALLVFVLTVLLLQTAGAAASPAALPISVDAKGPLKLVKNNLTLDVGLRAVTQAPLAVQLVATSACLDGPLFFQRGAEDSIVYDVAGADSLPLTMISAALRYESRPEPGPHQPPREADAFMIATLTGSPGMGTWHIAGPAIPNAAAAPMRYMPWHDSPAAYHMECAEPPAATGGYWIGGETQELIIPAGQATAVHVKVPAGAVPGSEDIEEEQPRPRFLVRVWDVAAERGVLVPVGQSYQPPAQFASEQQAILVTQDGLTAAAACAAAAAGVLAWKSHRWKDWHLPLPAPLLWLFTRLHRSRLLDHPVRRLLHDTIEANRGIRFTELRQKSGLAAGVVTHHLRMLEANGLVVSVHRGRQRHLYVKGAVDAITPGISETQEQILRLLSAEPLSQAELARRLGVSQQSISYNVRRLREQGRLSAAGAAASGFGLQTLRPTFDPGVLLSRSNVRDLAA